MSVNSPDNGLPAVQRFHQELKAAACAGVPLELASSDSWFSKGTVTLRKLDAIEVLIADRLARGQTLQQLTGKFDEIPSRYLAALRLYDQTGEMGLVLDGLATSALSRRQLASMFRGTIIYLLIVIMVAVIGLEFFANFIVPSIETMREDMRLFSAVEAPSRTEGAGLPRIVVTVLGYLAWAMLLFLLFGGSSKIVSLLGGRRYQRLRAAATAMRSIGVLVSHGVAVSEAASISCDLVGAGAADRRQVVSAVQGGSGVGGTPPADVRSFPGVGRKSTCGNSSDLAGDAVHGDRRSKRADLQPGDLLAGDQSAPRFGTAGGMIDGAVVFLTESIDAQLFQNLGNRADGAMMGEL